MRCTGEAAGGMLEALEKGDKATQEVHQGRTGLRAKNVSKNPRRYSWGDDWLEQHEGKEALDAAESNADINGVLFYNL